MRVPRSKIWLMKSQKKLLRKIRLMILMITNAVETNMMLHQLNNSLMIDHLILLTKNLRKRLSRLIAESLIHLHLRISNARFVGTTPLLPRIHYSIVAIVLALSDTFIMNAWSTGFCRKWQRRKKATWSPTVGNNLNVSFAKSHILMFSDPMVSHIVWLTSSQIFHTRRTIYFLSPLHLRRTVPEWYIS